jgi:hypothetical protein
MRSFPRAVPWALVLAMGAGMSPLTAAARPKPSASKSAKKNGNAPTAAAQRRGADPEAASDVNLSLPAGKGDNAVNDLKRAGMNAAQAVHEMREAGLDPKDVASGLRIYGVNTADKIAATLRDAGDDSMHIVTFLQEAAGVSPPVVASALSKLGLSGARNCRTARWHRRCPSAARRRARSRWLFHTPVCSLWMWPRR